MWTCLEADEVCTEHPVQDFLPACCMSRFVEQRSNEPKKRQKDRGGEKTG
jgi:hypothetical protein